MAELPTGIVTFLYTDIEGSTARWEEQPRAMRAAVERHDTLLRQAIADHRGHVFRTAGDGLCAAFAAAPDAVAAALAAQRALHAEDWGSAGPLRVRMALYTGAVEVYAGDYVGACLNRMARLLAAGHGGQVLVSLPTEELVRDALPAGAGLRELGEHRLRDLVQPERVYQLLHPDLPADFPSLKTLDTEAHNLPVQLTSFVGRERELAHVKALLGRTRLLTLTGTGGCGKTRLALQVAAELVDEYADGVWLAELAPLTNPDLVPQTVATALGVPEAPEQSLLSALLTALKGRRLLLVLDNCEHLIEACARLADALLRGCSGVQVLATSREALGIAGETAWRVPSLALPDVRRLPPVAQVVQYEAVRLFVDRAVAALPSFTIADHNAPAVAQICWRLDGIPLAIELAAARIKGLSAEQIAARLDQRFRLLTGGNRSALPRQQTLRATIDWSYDLLTEPERAVLRRLAVFAGGCTLEAAELVVSGQWSVVSGDEPSALTTRHSDGLPEQHSALSTQHSALTTDHWPLTTDVLDLLLRLVDKSLVLADETSAGETRYRLLETVRQYAWERLVEAGEADAVRDRHRDWYLALVETARREVAAGQPAVPRQRRLAPENDNLRAALHWAEARGDAHLTARLTVALGWVARGLLDTFRGRAAAADYERLLAGARQSGDRRQELEALLGLAQATYVLALDDQAPATIARSRELIEAARRLAHDLGDTPGLVRALLGSARLVDFLPDYHHQAEADLREALRLSHESGDEDLIIESTTPALRFLHRAEVEEPAEALVERLRARRDGARLNFHYFWLMFMHHFWGNFARAIECCDAGIELAGQLGAPPVQYATLKALSLLKLGRYGEAWTALLAEIADDEHPFGRAFRDYGLGLYQQELMADEEAAATFRGVAEQARRLNRVWLRQWAQERLALALARAGRLDEPAYDAIVQELAGAGAPAPPGVMAERLLAAGQPAAALHQAEAALQAADRRGYTPDRIVAGELQARILLRLNRPDQALAVAADALTLAERLDYRPLVWQLQVARAWALTRQGQADAAVQAEQAARELIRRLANTIEDEALRQRYLARAFPQFWIRITARDEASPAPLGRPG